MTFYFKTTSIKHIYVFHDLVIGQDTNEKIDPEWHDIFPV